jgi:hypothetical protein
LSVGSCGIRDTRATSAIKGSVDSKFRAMAYGVESSPSTSSTVFVQMPNMQISANCIKDEGNWFDISIQARLSLGTAAGGQLAVFVDGEQVGPSYGITNSTDIQVGMPRTVFLSKGIHSVQLMWAAAASGSLTAVSDARMLIVKEL